MDELLMTPPITGATIRGLLPRRTLEPLMEEEYSESCSSSSTQTETSASPEQVNIITWLVWFCPLVNMYLHCGQGNEIGDAADTCSTAAANPMANNRDTGRSDTTSVHMNTTKMHRSDSYRHIIEAEDESATFISRFNPTAKFIDIKPTPRSKTVKMYEGQCDQRQISLMCFCRFGFFNVRRERRVHECFPEGKHLIKLFSKDDCVADMSSSCPQKQISQRILKVSNLLQVYMHTYCWLFLCCIRRAQFLFQSKF